MNNKFNRREFIRRSSRIGLAAGLSSLLPTPLQHLFAQNKKEKGIDLAVVKGPPDQAAERAISTLGGIDSFVKEGDRVLLKPNLSFANPPEWGTTTDPNLIRAVAGLCIGAGARKRSMFAEDRDQRGSKRSEGSCPSPR
jgi:hypothetical protein